MNTQPKALRLADELEMWTLGEPAAEELRRLSAIEEAAKNLIKVKGRYHTEQAFNKLKELVQ
jgi:hypothetical protein